MVLLYKLESDHFQNPPETGLSKRKNHIIFPKIYDIYGSFPYFSFISSTAGFRVA